MSGVALEIVAAAGPAWVQDAGRPGRLPDGVPPGGALVPERLAEANFAVGNGPGAAAVECFGGVVVAARGGDLRVAWDGVAAVLRRDHVRSLTPSERVAYLAVAGGLDVPVVLGGRGLLAVAGAGGGPGRPLRAGDRLEVGVGGSAGAARAGGPGAAGAGEQGSGHDARAPVRFDPAAPIRVVPGPDLDRFAPDALARFLATRWTVGVGDRVGTRLVGPAGVVRHAGAGGVAGGPPPAPSRSALDTALSTPMTRGAVQIPAGGAPIVLGPDHPATGGYPVLAVVIAADHGAFAVRAPGETVRFAAIGVAEARAATAEWRAAYGTAGVAASGSPG